MKINHFMLVAVLCSLAQPSVFAEAEDNHQQSDSLSYCGHEDHDGAENRLKAAKPIHWQLEKFHKGDTVAFKILGFNDFHGALEVRSLSGRPVGGAAVLASYLHSEAQQSDNGALIVHAGDHVGATPPVSALLQDEPSIQFLNMLGNHFCKFNWVYRKISG
jgi:5'-nucleotidase